jgi:ABC-2 type transport system ATP-binding protein
MTDWMISTKNLAKTYGHGRKTVEAVSSLDLQVRQGEIFGLVGPDGAGKTTTMQMLCGLLTPTSGSATVADVDIVNQPGRLGGKIGYMSEGFTLYGALSVDENIDFFARLYDVPPSVISERKARLLAVTHMTEARHRRAEHLSGGMKKKLALACALTYTPQILFLDEPTTGVDPVSRRDFWLLLNDFLEQGITIFVTTPYMDEAERFHRIALMHQGKIIACDTPSALKAGIQGERLDLLAEPQQAAAAALWDHPQVSQVQIFGERVHALVSGAKEADSLQAHLSDRNISIAEIRRSAPGLEDVFVSMLSREKTAVASTVHPLSYNNDRVPNGSNAPEQNLPAAIQTDGLTKQFGTFNAVQNVTLRISQGQIFGFLGPNGSGKTTTIRMLCGLLPPTSGTGTVAGWDIHRQPGQIKTQIGYMSQKFSLYPDLTVVENLEFYGGVYGLRAAELAQRKGWVLEMAGLLGHERDRTGALSGGWKQRLALGCAILHRPQVLFLDEPTSGVDPISRRAFWALISELSRQGTTIFVTTHAMDEAEHCHALGLIYNGQVIASGSPASLRANMRAGEMLEVRCGAPFPALKVVKNLEGVLGASLFGDRLHVLVADADRVAPVIEQALTTGGWPPSRIEPIPFSLEDLFVIFIEMSRESQVLL